METQQPQYSRMLAGAAIGAGFAFLFLTSRGRQLLESSEPWLDELIRDMQRLRGTVAKVRDAVDEGRRSFDAVSKLGSFGPSAQGASPDVKH